LIGFLGTRGDAERGQAKECRQEPNGDRFHDFSFYFVSGVVGWDTGCRGALHGGRDQQSLEQRSKTLMYVRREWR
jgi:hypothetical protein